MDGEKQEDSNSRSAATTSSAASAPVTMATACPGSSVCTRAPSSSLSIISPDRPAVQVLILGNSVDILWQASRVFVVLVLFLLNRQRLGTMGPLFRLDWQLLEVIVSAGDCCIRCPRWEETSRWSLAHLPASFDLTGELTRNLQMHCWSKLTDHRGNRQYPGLLHAQSPLRRASVIDSPQSAGIVWLDSWAGNRWSFPANEEYENVAPLRGLRAHQPHWWQRRVWLQQMFRLLSTVDLILDLEEWPWLG